MNKNIVIYILMCFFEFLKNELKEILMFIINFKNIFDFKLINMLFTYDEHNHNIDLILNKTFSYEFLYNMFKKNKKRFKVIFKKN